MALLLFLVVVLAGGGAVLLTLLGDDPEPSAPVRPGGATTARAAEPPAPAADLRAPADDPAAKRATAEAPPPDLSLRPHRADEHAARFSGPAGQIRGYIETSDDTPFPRTWRLVLEPSTTLIGREHAESRVVEFEAGEQEFVVRDLPLAGYDVIAEADGLNGRRHSVLLDARSSNPYITLQLYPAGYVVGRILDAAGNAAEGLEVTLLGVTSVSSVETRTDILGNYRFDSVLDGEYQLLFGHHSSPVLPPESIRFSAPSMTFPDRTLPEFSALDLLVLDSDGNAVFDATVEGSGSNGGYVKTKTDVNGRARAPFLPAGRYRLTAQHELHGRARRSIDVGTEPTDTVIRFSPRRY
ncbi:MAG: carboxypeptidase-like regulatory domain-containing protein [Planctomycetota bacterium]